MDYVPFEGSFHLTGKTAVVTGAAKGIGKAIALMFAEKGANLVLVDLDHELDQLQKQMKEKGQRAVTIQGDITQSETLQEILKLGLNSFGKIEILVNNAGISRLDNAEDLSERDWDDVLAVNLTAQFRLAQVIGRQMIHQKYVYFQFHFHWHYQLLFVLQNNSLLLYWEKLLGLILSWILLQ